MTRTNRERKVLADPEPIDNFPPVLPLFFYFCLGLFGLLAVLVAHGPHRAPGEERTRLRTTGDALVAPDYAYEVSGTLR